MSFLSELEAVVEEAWPIIEDHDVVEMVTIRIANRRDIDIEIDFALPGIWVCEQVEGNIEWPEEISTLFEKLRDKLRGAAKEIGDDCEDRAAPNGEDTALHKEKRRKIKALAPTPLEELAEQAE